ncbi:MAG: response regulator transcription factor [Williamsia sp.]|nr:response regulator transcription factor [Williamsia sp.]
MINCLIIDDEPLALDLLEDYISQIPLLKLAGRFDRPLQSLSYFDQGSIDLIFLDVNMPAISGIDFYRSLTKKPEVIFTTAYSEYALKGFELNAIDYLVKPIALDRFMNAVNKARDYIEYKNSKGNLHNNEFFFINASHKILKVFYNDILYMEGLKDYTKIYLESNQKPLLILHNLKYFEELLPAQQFVRIHRSYIIAVSKLNAITRKAVTIGDITMPLSDNYRSGLFSLLNLNL